MPIPSKTNEPRGSRARRAARATGVAARLAALGALTLLGCDPYVQGNGVYGEETRVVAPFQGVLAEDGLVAAVTAGGDAFSVVVSGDENVVAHVETKVDGSGMLLVRMDDDVPYESMHAMRVAILAPTLEVLRATAGAAIVASGLAAERLVVEAGDGGDVRIAGPGGATLHATLRGGEPRPAHLDARDYPVSTATVDLSGGAVAQLAVTREIEGRATGSAIENFAEGRCAVELHDGATCREPSG